ncbi:uncharacterized protein LOC130949752 [Arachis stenosperma]|uniref:uncharacterized protein LOC130949752 n=1 Tax=Arachis stenosperma TaxID=217475 RepID=UPI0025AC257B|nr:uncharacterized protein LOC130949752 [Arachis stenosperma]
MQHDVVNQQGSFGQTTEIDKELIVGLMQMIDEHNVIAQLFRRAREFYGDHPSQEFCLRLFSQRVHDPRIYNYPSCDEVAALIVGDFESSDCGRDIIVQSTSGQLQRIYETHALYLPLQYPFIFPYGEDRYQLNIPYRGVQATYVRGRRTRMPLQSQRLFEIRKKQSTIRGEFLHGIEEAMQRGDVEASSIGTRVILPSSFTGGKRYMFNNCQDAMAICKHYGYPDLFLTITYNPNWLEFQRYTRREGIPIADRPDISCRVFHAKLKCILTDLKVALFSILSMPLLFYVELPNPAKFPNLYRMVTKYMIHGPCGRIRSSSPCMKDGKCSKFYPKQFVNETSFDDDGYPVYKRRDMGITVKLCGADIDNRFVVPYNPLLLMKYQAHINLEFCNKSNIIKYLFKYVNKGPDRLTATVDQSTSGHQDSQILDEIK